MYSVVVRKGPDKAHYDICFTEDRLLLSYLGEHWETFRPRTGIQKRSDLLIYSVRKRRKRTQTIIEKDDMEIEYCSIRGIEIEKRMEKGKAIIYILLSSGERLEIEYPLKIHGIVKRLVQHLQKKVGECKPR